MVFEGHDEHGETCGAGVGGAGAHAHRGHVGPEAVGDPVFVLVSGGLERLGGWGGGFIKR